MDLIHFCDDTSLVYIRNQSAMKMCGKKAKKKKALVYFLVRIGIPKFQPGAMAL